MKDLKTTNFFNDVIRIIKWFLNGFKDRDNSKIRGFFGKIFREMKR